MRAGERALCEESLRERGFIHDPPGTHTLYLDAEAYVRLEATHRITAQGRGEDAWLVVRCVPSEAQWWTFLVGCLPTATSTALSYAQGSCV